MTSATFSDTGSTYDGGVAKVGGAFYCTYCTSVDFTNCIFNNNVARNGGAIALYLAKIAG